MMMMIIIIDYYEHDDCDNLWPLLRSHSPHDSNIWSPCSSSICISSMSIVLCVIYHCWSKEAHLYQNGRKNIRLGIGEPPQLPTHVSESPGAPPPQAELVSPNQTWWFDMITLEWRVIVINQTKPGIRFHVIT